MSEWISIKDRMPPFGEFVEVIYPDKSRLTEINRDFAAYWKDETGCFWTSAGMDERDWSTEGFKIKYWKPMSCDTKGRKPFLKTDRNGYFIVFMKSIRGSNELEKCI